MPHTEATKAQILQALKITNLQYQGIRRLLKQDLTARGTIAHWRQDRRGPRRSKKPLSLYSTDVAAATSSVIQQFFTPLPAGLSQDVVDRHIGIMIWRLRTNEAEHAWCLEQGGRGGRSAEFVVHWHCRSRLTDDLMIARRRTVAQGSYIPGI